MITHTINAQLPAEFTLEEADLMRPHKVLAQQSVRHHGDNVKQLLIQWQHKPIEEATWEDKLMIQRKFPTSSLEDKTVFEGGGSDRERHEEDKEVRIALEPKHCQPTW